MNATVSPTPVAGASSSDATQRVALQNVSWITYDRLVKDHLDAAAPRMAYDNGVLEIVSPGSDHERRNRTVALFVEIVAAEWGIDAIAVGSMTYRRAELRQGFEPDSSFYLGSADRVRGARQIDPTSDPPPDLVVEVDASRSSLQKLPLYAAMGVPEAWRVEEDRVEFAVLVGNEYRASAESRVLPAVSAELVTGFLASSRATPRPAWFRAVAAWARERRVPLS